MLWLYCNHAVLITVYGCNHWKWRHDSHRCGVTTRVTAWFIITRRTRYCDYKAYSDILPCDGAASVKPMPDRTVSVSERRRRWVSLVSSILTAAETSDCQYQQCRCRQKPGQIGYSYGTALFWIGSVQNIFIMRSYTRYTQTLCTIS